MMLVFLAAALGCCPVSAQSNGLTVPATLPARVPDQLRSLALDELKARFPNIEPSCFLYSGTATDLAAGQNYTEVTVVFTDCHEPIQYAKGPVGQAMPLMSGTEYLVRMKRDGELIGIERHRHRDGFLEITPAPDQGIQPRPPATVPMIRSPFMIRLPLEHTNSIMILRPGEPLQTPP